MSKYWTYDTTAAAENSRRTNQSGPLRRVIAMGGDDGSGPSYEVLECGHAGRYMSKITIQGRIDAGKRRRCPRCGAPRRPADAI